MPRPPIDSQSMTKFITRTRCTPAMKCAIRETAEALGISDGDVIRGCISYMLKVDMDSKLIERIMENASPGSRPGSEMDREDKDEHL